MAEAPLVTRRRRRPDRAPRAIAALPVGVWVLGGVSLLMDISSEMIHGLLPVLLVTTLGASAATLGVIEGIAEATALVVRLLSGATSDWWGRRKGLAVAGYALSAVTKPLFAIAGSAGVVLAARTLDRVGKGVRGAPRDALLGDLAPPERRGAAFGLRQSLDTVGAMLGPLLAAGLMLAWAGDIRAVLRVAIAPALLAVGLLVVGVREPGPGRRPVRSAPLRRASLRRLGSSFWWIVVVGGVFSLARFSEAFLVLRALDVGLPTAGAPLALVAMNVVFAVTAYPVGRLSDRVSHRALLALGIAVLVGADVVLAVADRTWAVMAGIGLWGLHLGVTQGLLASMVAGSAPADLRGTAFGVFHLAAGAALLAASVLAGWLWSRFGAPATFWAGAGFAAVALVGLARRRGPPRAAVA